MKNSMKSLVVLFCSMALVVSGCSKKSEPTGPVATTGIIAGRVIDITTSLPLSGVLVSSIPPSQSVTTDGNGSYKITGVPPSTYNMRAVKNGYTEAFAAIAVVAGQTISADIAMQPVVAGGNNAPSVPHSPIPADNSSNQPLSVTLRWASTDPDNDPVSYDVYFGTTNPPSVAIATEISATSQVKGNLSSNTTYYWSVVAKDGKGGVTTGPVWQFTTEEQGNPSTDSAIALDFTGSNGYTGKDKIVRVPHASDLTLSTQSFTIEAWVMLSNIVQYQWIATKATSNANGDWLFGIIRGRPHLDMRNGTNHVTAPSVLEQGKWYHLAAVADMSLGKMTLYINGDAVASSSISGSAVITGNDVLIGGREFHGAPSEGLQGMIHELRIWHTPRSESDIDDARNRRLNGNEEGLVGYWRLNEGDGFIAHDRSGRGHDGILVNDPKWVKTLLPIQ